MFKVTRDAEAQIRKSAEVGDTQGLALRVAATRMPDGGIDYRMGFDEKREGDTAVSFDGFEVIISEADRPLLDGAEMDFVEIEPGEFRFIFLNPNDPEYRPPTERTGG